MPGKGGNDRKFSRHLLRGGKGAEIHTGGEKKSGCDGVKGKVEKKSGCDGVKGKVEGGKSTLEEKRKVGAMG